MNLFLSKIWSIGILVVVLAGGFFAWQKFLNNETDNWESYYNELYGMELKYPASWALNETPAGNFIQINVSNGVRGPEDESMSPCQPGIAALVFQIGKLRDGQQAFEEFVNFKIENPERGQPPEVKPELIRTTVGGHNAIKISDAHNGCEKDFYYVEQGSNSYATISFIVDKGEDKLIIDKILSTFRFFGVK